MRYFGGTGEQYKYNYDWYPLGPFYTTGDVIGILLNMNHKNVTFYKNDIRIGTVIGADQLKAAIYYPIIRLLAPGDEVISC